MNDLEIKQIASAAYELSMAAGMSAKEARFLLQQMGTIPLTLSTNSDLDSYSYSKTQTARCSYCTTEYDTLPDSNCSNCGAPVLIA